MITKHYKGSSKGVTNINLAIEAGDIYAFIGHNGAGKTTTLKCVAGIHDFEQGEILINGTSMKENPLCHYFGFGASAEAVNTSRAFCGIRPQSCCGFEEYYERDL